jgi:DNA-binding LytR/AlgR family response regulator
VVFVDINLPGKDGVSLATQLAMLPQPPRLVFRTGNANRATDAFRLVVLRRRRRTWVHTVREEFATYYPLADLMQWLGGGPFIQIGRHAVVNLQAVELVTVTASIACVCVTGLEPKSRPRGSYRRV